MTVRFATFGGPHAGKLQAALYYARERRLRRQSHIFTPTSLFAAGEQGTWYDPSDLSTLYQDTAGTTPVTAAGQTVARINDKSGRGNHATQATEASRPIYGIEPAGGRRNLLTYTEGTVSQLSVSLGVTDAATTISGFAASIQFGNNSVLRYAYKSLAITAGLSYTASFFVQMDDGSAPIVGTEATGGDFSVICDTDYAPTVTVSLVDGGIYRVTGTISSATGGTTRNVGIIKNTSQSSKGFRVTGFQLETGSTATAYQRVTDQWNVTQAGVPSVAYLAFDGTDDWLLTGTITPGVDGVSVFAGIRKISDAARGAVVELTASTASNNGAFLLAAPNAASATIAFESKGTTLTDAIASSGVAAPITAVVTASSRISTDANIIRVNGVQADSDTGDQGSGNFSAAPLYIGRRGGASLPLNGRIYALLVRFAESNASQIASTETWVAGKTGVTL